MNAIAAAGRRVGQHALRNERSVRALAPALAVPVWLEKCRSNRKLNGAAGRGASNSLASHTQKAEAAERSGGTQRRLLQARAILPGDKLDAAMMMHGDLRAVRDADYRGAW